MTPPAKICPKCQTVAPLDAPICRDCGHGVRTQFIPPAMPSSALPPLSPVPPLHTQQPLPSRQNWRMPTVLLFSSAAIGLLVIAGLTLTPKGDAPLGAMPQSQAGQLAAPDGTPVVLRDGGTSWRSHIALAVNDPADLDLWQKTLGARVYGTSSEGVSANEVPGLGEIERPDDTYTQDRLVQQGRIVVLEDGTPAQVLFVDKGAAHVEITSGINKGIKGSVFTPCLFSSAGQQLYPMKIMPAPPIQGPDGKPYPMAGIEYPADATHPRGSINHQSFPSQK